MTEVKKESFDSEIMYEARKHNFILDERMLLAAKPDLIILHQFPRGEELDVSVAFLSRAERGNVKINLARITQICDILDISIPYVTIDVHCSKGTYIRSLCDDIGTRLGCGAIMCQLRRTYTAGFSIDDAYTLDELEAVSDIELLLKPTDSLFSDLPAIYLNEKQEKSIINGVRMTWRKGKEGQAYRVYGADGRFLCVSRLDDMRLVLVKSFWS